VRFDNEGMFWQDVQAGRNQRHHARPMPPIPETGWRPPAFFPNLSGVSVLSLDVETRDDELNDAGPGWARGKGYVVGISVGTRDGGRWYFPVRHSVEPEMNMVPEHVFAWLRDVLHSSHLKCIVGSNLLYDLGWLIQEGVFANRDPVFRRLQLVDVEFAGALLNERGEVNLDAQSARFLGEQKKTELVYKWCSDFYGGNPNEQRMNLWRAPPRLVGPYGEGDADLPLRIAPFLYKELEREGLLDLFALECGLIPLLLDMRFAGVSVDIGRATQMRDQLLGRQHEAQKKLDAQVGFPVDVNASASLARAFDKFRLQYPRNDPTKAMLAADPHAVGSPSFVKEWLKTVEHPIAEDILEIKRLEKLRSTFIEGAVLNSHVNGKVYCSFLPLRMDDGGARSGRFASRDPNLQNIPIRDKELGNLIRSLFIPDPGHRRWRKYDYSQIEYRFLVHFATGPGADEARRRYLDNPDTDYHVWVQELVQSVLGMVIDRRPIKNLNFGITYGMGKRKLMRSLNLKSMKEAKEFLEAYHKGVPFAGPTMDSAMEEAARTGLILTILGRRNRFDLWESAVYEEGGELGALPYEMAIRKWGNIRRAYLHKALNRKLQGSAADLMKMAMFICWRDGIFDATGTPRLTVHDELDFSDPGTREAEEGFEAMQYTMENAIPLRIPVRAEREDGTNWGTLEKVKAAA
jgi:DNA polymerase I-like protein with 3'-5' exonuclease and polymerase domains